MQILVWIAVLVLMLVQLVPLLLVSENDSLEVKLVEKRKERIHESALFCYIFFRLSLFFVSLHAN